MRPMGHKYKYHVHILGEITLVEKLEAKAQ